MHKINKIRKSDKIQKSENRQKAKSEKMKMMKNVSWHKNGQKRGGMSLKGVNVTLRVFRAIWWGHFCQTAWTPVFCVFGLRMGFHDFWPFLTLFWWFFSFAFFTFWWFWFSHFCHFFTFYHFLDFDDFWVLSFFVIFLSFFCGVMNFDQFLCQF